MKARRELGTPQLTMCAQVPFGSCLCGRAASTGEIVFSGNIDEPPQHQCNDMVPHGHYCVPILSRKKEVLGVINLYLKEGHARTQKEEEFLYAIANTLASIIELKHTEKALKKRERELETKSHNLEETNIALKVLLKRRDEDRTEVEEKVMANVIELVEPYLEKLKNSGLDERQETYAGILESNLEDITSSFTRSLSSKYLNFTPTEIQVANLVKQGKTTKEIADLMNISHKTIEVHRKNMRKKLHLESRKANLRTHLLSFQQ